MPNPNILLVVIDSLRSDKTFGTKKTSITPIIDSLIKDGVFLSQAISSAASTILAMSSLLSGTYPFRIGLGGKSYNKLGQNIPNLIKILNKNGYNTYATAPEIAKDFGLVCDFQNPDTSYDNYYSLFSGLGDEILNKFSDNKLKTPWFFYIHLFDLHTPVIVPSNFQDKKFGSTQYEKMVSAIDNWLSNLLKCIDKENTIIIITSDHGEYIPVLETKNGNINLESSEIEQSLWKIGNKIPKNLFPVKRKMGKIIRTSRSKLKSSKIDDNKLSVYEKRVLLDSRMSTGHRMYDDLLKIPLIFSGYGISKNLVISEIVRQVDIFPTILDLLSIPSPNSIDGTSLVPLWNNKHIDELVAHIESPPSIDGSSTKYVGIRNKKFKYIRDLQNKENNVELYDLVSDPYEEHNLAKKELEKIHEMEEKLISIRNKEFFPETNFDNDEREKVEDILKKLGYT